MSPIVIGSLVLAGVVVGGTMLIVAFRALGFAIMPDTTNRGEIEPNPPGQPTLGTPSRVGSLSNVRSISPLPENFAQLAILLETLPRLIEMAKKFRLADDRESPAYVSFASEVENFVRSFLDGIRQVAAPSVLEQVVSVTDLLKLSEAWGAGGIPGGRTDLMEAIRYGEVLDVLMIRPLERFEEAIARSEGNVQAQRILGVLPILLCANSSPVETVRRISQHEFAPWVDEGIANGVENLQAGFITSRRHALVEAARREGDAESRIH